MDISFTDFNWFRGQGSGRCCHSGMGTYQYICVCLAKENAWKNMSEEKITLPQENKPLKFGVDIYDCMKSWHIFFVKWIYRKNYEKYQLRAKKNWNVHVLLCVEQELDNWLRKKCLENLAKSISTLQSLTALLEGISNIVIQDDIGQQVYFFY